MGALVITFIDIVAVILLVLWGGVIARSIFGKNFRVASPINWLLFLAGLIWIIARIINS